jgi:hypothetical protein
VGYNENGTINNCYSTGNVAGDKYVGGMVGGNYYSSTIYNCYSTGSVDGNDFVGGLVGYNYNRNGTITNCYATGIVTGSESVGGLVGLNDYSKIDFCYWDVETSGQDTSAGGTGKTTAEMQNSATFFTWCLCGNEGIVTIDEGKDYPHLWWEEMPGEPIYTFPSYGGSGEPNDPYLIYTAEQLNTIALVPCELDRHFRLMADIDLSGFAGTSFNIISYFKGVFDGNGHTISNFTYDSNGVNGIGLFRSIDALNAEIKNLQLIDPNVEGGRYVGGLVGSGSGTITNCSVRGGSVKGNEYVGGMVGYSSNIMMTECHSACSVSGDRTVGGLVGLNSSSGNLTNCTSTSEVSGTLGAGGLVGANRGRLTSCSSAGLVISEDGTAGGLMGGGNGYRLVDCYNTASVIGETAGGLVGGGGGRMDRCYSTGSVTGYEYAGGLVGELDDEDDLLRMTNCYSICLVNGYIAGGLVGCSDHDRITNCYSGGSVRGQYTGGLLGIPFFDEVTNSFWNIETSGEPNMCGYDRFGDCNNSYGRTTAEMYQQSTFTDWDFSTPIWMMTCEGMSYPKLSWWQPILGDFLCPDGVDFFDYSFFTSHWQEDNCGASNDCDGTDLDLLGKVEINDLRIFVGSWLRGF